MRQNEKLNKKTIIIFSLLIIVFSIGTYLEFKINSHKVVLKSYAVWPITTNWGLNTWDYMHFYKGNYYLRRVTNRDNVIGSVDLIKVDSNDIENSMGIKTLEKLEKNKMIFFGKGFHTKDSLFIYGGDKLLKKIDAQDNFGVILELHKKTKIKMSRKGELFAVYLFNLAKTSRLNFYPIQLDPPKRKFEKTITFNEKGEFKATIKPLVFSKKEKNKH